MNIGKPKRVYTVEPLVTPVPAEPDEKPAVPEPEPARPDEVTPP
jgi:hypothetical protein